MLANQGTVQGIVRDPPWLPVSCASYHSYRNFQRDRESWIAWIKGLNDILPIPVKTGGPLRKGFEADGYKPMTSTQLGPAKVFLHVAIWSAYCMYIFAIYRLCEQSFGSGPSLESHKLGDTANRLLSHQPPHSRQEWLPAKSKVHKPQKFHKSCQSDPQMLSDPLGLFSWGARHASALTQASFGEAGNPRFTAMESSQECCRLHSSIRTRPKLQMIQKQCCRDIGWYPNFQTIPR